VYPLSDAFLNTISYPGTGAEWKEYCRLCNEDSKAHMRLSTAWASTLSAEVCRAAFNELFRRSGSNVTF